MRTAANWSKDLESTLGLSLRQPLPILGTGKNVIEATIAQIQLDVLAEVSRVCRTFDSNGIGIHVAQMQEDIKKKSKVIDATVQV